MTTTVIVQAHCTPDKEVEITFIDDKVTIQTDETFECVVYGDKVVSVREVLKTTAEVAESSIDDHVPIIAEQSIESIVDDETSAEEVLPFFED